MATTPPNDEESVTTEAYAKVGLISTVRMLEGTPAVPNNSLSLPRAAMVEKKWPP
jgi:hypothetical protein